MKTGTTLALAAAAVAGVILYRRSKKPGPAATTWVPTTTPGVVTEKVGDIFTGNDQSLAGPPRLPIMASKAGGFASLNSQMLL